MTTALITGATRGVGLELARRLAGTGHDVWVGARDLDRGREVAASIGAKAVAIDVTDAVSVRTAAARLRDEVGSLDVLVNNAGISGAQRPPAEADPDDLEPVLATNVIGATRVLVAFTPCSNRAHHRWWSTSAAPWGRSRSTPAPTPSGHSSRTRCPRRR